MKKSISEWLQSFDAKSMPKSENKSNCRKMLYELNKNKQNNNNNKSRKNLNS